jgi:hypothetical protein
MWKIGSVMTTKRQRQRKQPGSMKANGQFRTIEKLQCVRAIGIIALN